MAGSFRRRLLAIAAFTVLACGAAIIAVLSLGRITIDERTAHARDNVQREVERMRGALEVVPHSERARPDRQAGELRSGYVAGGAARDQSPFVAEAVDQAARSGDPVVIDRAEEDGTPVLVASAA